MKKLAYLELEDAFAWGVWQKIRLTGNREITFKELEEFARAVTKQAYEKLGYDQIWFKFNRDNTIKFYNYYRDYTTHTDNSIKLNDNLTYEDTLKIFPMGVVPVDLLPILLDDNIGEKIFANEIAKKDENFSQM